MISIAAELAAMHPQTLRLYERRGLLQPQRSAKNTRLYSRADVDRLQRIQELTELGLNLAGVERVLALESQMAVMREQMERLQAELDRAADDLRDQVRAGRTLHAPRPGAGRPHGGRAHRQAPPLTGRRRTRDDDDEEEPTEDEDYGCDQVLRTGARGARDRPGRGAPRARQHARHRAPADRRAEPAGGRRRADPQSPGHRQGRRHDARRQVRPEPARRLGPARRASGRHAVHDAPGQGGDRHRRPAVAEAGRRVRRHRAPAARHLPRGRGPRQRHPQGPRHDRGEPAARARRGTRHGRRLRSQRDRREHAQEVHARPHGARRATAGSTR